MAADPPTYTTLINAFTVFLTVSIHTLLYQRSLYPCTSFLTTRAYNYPVQQSRHPAVCAWITDAVSAVHAQLLTGAVASIALVVLDPASRPLERVVWDVSRFPVVSREDAHKALAPDAALVDLEEQFRGVMARMAGLDGRLKPLPSGCSFTIAVEVREDAEPPIGRAQAWIPVEPGLQKRRGGEGRDGEKGGRDLGGIRTVPVRAVEAGAMVFEMWVEEGRAKLEGEMERSSDADDA